MSEFKIDIDDFIPIVETIKTSQGCINNGFSVGNTTCENLVVREKALTVGAVKILNITNNDLESPQSGALLIGGNIRVRGNITSESSIKIKGYLREYTDYNKLGAIVRNNLVTVGSLVGTAKWRGGVLAPNGKIYCAPANASQILVIDTRNDSIGAINVNNPGDGWFGGCLAPNGKIYFAPSSSSGVLVVDPRKNTVTVPMAPGVGWSGGVLAPNGRIYCAPYLNKNVLVIDPTIDRYTILNTYPELSGAWSGGVLHSSGKIYCAPTTFRPTNSVLAINTVTNTLDTDEIKLLVPGNWSGGALHQNGKIYFVPNNSDSVLIVDPDSPVTPITGTITGATYTDSTRTLVVPGAAFLTELAIGDNIIITAGSDVYVSYVQQIINDTTLILFPALGVDLITPPIMMFTLTTPCWATKVDGESNNIKIYSVSSFGDDGGVYIGGDYNSPVVDFYNIDGTVTRNLSKLTPGSNSFIAQYNANGTVSWAAQIGGDSSDVMFALTHHDNDSGVYAAGRYDGGSASFYNENGTLFKTITSPYSWGQCYVTRYNSLGYGVWAARIISNTNIEILSASSIGNNNGVFVVGFYASAPITIYDATDTSSIVLANSGDFDSFIAHYHSSGSLIWATRIAGPGTEIGTAISANGHNNGLYVTGRYSATVTFYNASGAAAASLTAVGGFDGFLAKYDKDGTLDWVTRVSGNDANLPSAVCSIIPNSGAYWAGQFSSTTLNIYNAGGGAPVHTLTNSTGALQSYFIKYDKDGIFQWALKIMCPTSSSEINSISVSSGVHNVYVGGHFDEETVEITDTFGNTVRTLTDGFFGNSFIAKFNPGGTLLWATKILYTDDTPDVQVSAIKNDMGVYVGSGLNFIELNVYNSDDTIATTLYAGSSGSYLVKYDTNGFLICDGPPTPGPIDDVSVTKKVDFTTISGLIGGSWSGAATGLNGLIYGMPYNSDRVLIIDPNSPTSAIAGTFASATYTNSSRILNCPGATFLSQLSVGDNLIITNTSLVQRYVGYVESISNNTTLTLLYALGADLSAGSIVSIQRTRKADITSIVVGAGTNKHVGAVLGPNGRIYGVPFNSTNILKITPGVPIYANQWALEPQFNKY